MAAFTPQINLILDNCRYCLNCEDLSMPGSPTRQEEYHSLNAWETSPRPISKRHGYLYATRRPCIEYKERAEGGGEGGRERERETESAGR